MDIDFITNVGGEFSLSIENGGQAVSGNRKLVNRFGITFLKSPQSFFYNGIYEADPFGGNAMQYIGSPRVLNDLQGIAAGVQASILATVTSIKSDQEGLQPTERLVSASLSSLGIVGDEVQVGINVVPEEIQPWADLVINLPITRYGA